MISEKEYNEQVRKAEAMTKEEKEECHKNWEIFQTKSRKCKYRNYSYSKHTMNMKEEYRIKDYFCTVGSMTGGCVFVWCPKQSEVLSLEEERRVR